MATLVCLFLPGTQTVLADLADGSKAAGLEQCVEETVFMRKNHMDVLLHQRDRTVHDGVRTREHSLVECVYCHAGSDGNGNFTPVNADGQFCAGCHKKAAVDIDCFQCHATRPDAEANGGDPAVFSAPPVSVDSLFVHGGG